MNKQYAFLAGFFRSGNTVLSALLNQNPKIYTSPISGFVEHLYQSDIIVKNSRLYTHNNVNQKRSENFTNRSIDVFYEDVEKEIVIDRAKSWINPDNIDLIKKYVTKNPKIIFTTRPILEIMVSFISIAKDSIIKDLKRSNFVLNHDLSINDNLADFLYSEHSNLGLSMRWAFESIDNPDNKGMIHIVKYEDLIDAPQKTMNDIYNFLETELFNNDFNNIQKIEDYEDAARGVSEDLHKVRRTIGRSSIKVEDYLGMGCIEKYKNLRYF